MLADSGLPILETAIGAGLGLLLGFVTLNCQHKREKWVVDEEAQQSALDSLSRFTQAAGLNIDALPNPKLKIIEYLEPEVAMMQEAIDAYPDNNSRSPAGRSSGLKTVSETYRHFYKTIPSVVMMLVPDFREFSLLEREMLALIS